MECKDRLHVQTWMIPFETASEPVGCDCVLLKLRTQQYLIMELTKACSTSEAIFRNMHLDNQLNPEVGPGNKYNLKRLFETMENAIKLAKGESWVKNT